MRNPIAVYLTSVCLGGAALTVSGEASASDHYYAIAQANITGAYVGTGAADLGASVNLWTNILHSTCNIVEHNFVNHEFWYNLQGNSTAYWVEVGFKDGATNGADCVTKDVFWADSRNGGGYNEHHTGWQVSGGEWEGLAIESNGQSCQWNVLWEGTVIGTSTANCPGDGRILQAGIETTSQTTGSVQGWESSWAEWGGFNGNWQSGWDGGFLCQNSTNNGNCSSSGNPRIQWDSGIGTEEVLNESF